MNRNHDFYDPKIIGLNPYALTFTISVHAELKLLVGFGPYGALPPLIRFTQMAQEATRLDYLHEVEHMRERVDARAEVRSADAESELFAEADARMYRISQPVPR